MSNPNIVGTYRVKNEERFIEKSLESVMDICSEIVIYDDNSTDKTVEICSSFDKVVDIVCSQLTVSKDDVTSESSFVEDLGADSLDTVELVMAFEEEFGLEIPDDEAENITTIQSAADWIENNS